MSMTNAQLFNPQGIATPRGYSHVAVVESGRTVYIAGQVALDEQGELVGANDVRAQAERVFANLNAAVMAAGGTFHDIVKLTYYLTDIGDLPVMREVRDKYVNLAHPPVSTALQVSRLFQPVFLVEVEAIAIVGQS